MDGTLDILQGGDINIDGTPDEGNVVANGVVVMRSLGDSQANVDTLAQFDGAHFALRTGATVSNYVTNLAYAAENVTSGTITVTGAVSAGDVVFNEASNGTLVISVETAEEQEINTVLSFTTMDLNGATLTVDADSRVTGTVTAPYGDGTADAEIQLSRAAGEFTIESSSLATATGTEYIAYISNVLGAGSMTVAAGTVDVYHDGDVIGFKANGKFQVASGATLVVEDATLTANNDARTGASNITVSGTMNPQRHRERRERHHHLRRRNHRRRRGCHPQRQQQDRRGNRPRVPRSRRTADRILQVHHRLRLHPRLRRSRPDRRPDRLERRHR